MIKKHVWCLFASLLAVFVLAFDAGAQQDADVIIGERFSMESDVLGEERAYWVYLPASYHNDRFAPQRYPVLYLLDGDAHFHSASGVVQFMSTGINGNIQTPEMIIVAIPNTDRTRDLTPSETTLGYDGSDVPASGGGGDAFLEFIDKELFAKIDAKYRTRPYRVLVGHSLGGLLTLHALVDRPDMFQSYIAIDPSLWWNDQRLLKRAETYFAETKDLEAAVYVTFANNPALVPGEISLMRQTGEAFARAMEPAVSARFRSASRYFEAEDHGSVPLLSLYHGLLHIFDGYKPSIAAALEDPTELVTHFREVSARFGMEFVAPEPLVNQLGYALLARDVDKAIEFFAMNAEQYPESYNVHDSLGEAYAAKDQTGLAIQSYERSLALNPDNDNAKARLEALRGPRR